MATLYKHRIYCETDAKYEYIWLETDTPPTTCPVNSEHTVDEENTTIIEINESSNPTKVSQLPFAEKVLSNGKKLYTRVHGKEFTINNASEDLDFTVPYAQCKINGLEIVGAEEGDKIQLKIIDTSGGTYSGVPNYVLNQFGFDVYPAEDYYQHRSNYDADLYINMIIKIVYDAKDVTLDPSRKIYINYMLHEVKD